MHSAVVMSLAGLLVLAARHAAGRRCRGARRTCSPCARRLCRNPCERWFRLYALAWAVSFLALSFAWVMPGLTQPMLALAALRWAFFFMLARRLFRSGAEAWRASFSLAFAVELATGIGAYFSDFKTVFLRHAVCRPRSGTRVSSRSLRRGSCSALLVVALAIVWTAVKGRVPILRLRRAGGADRDRRLRTEARQALRARRQSRHRGPDKARPISSCGA